MSQMKRILLASQEREAHRLRERARNAKLRTIHTGLTQLEQDVQAGVRQIQKGEITESEVADAVRPKINKKQ